jgi:alkanesulfonate monooxygenase SsuD/methylene tetrahydromethanopterin reductase-like flavin-dependent oxidoreductase (luciferase family)
MEISVCLDTSLRWADIAELARRADDAGLYAVYVPDHFGEFGEAWTILTAIASTTDRIRIGTLVLSVTHRPVGVVAAMAQTLQKFCEGRLVLGVGAGWDQAEHAAYGLPFPSAPDRLDLLDHAVTRMRQSVEAPLLVGGGGERRTMRTAAASADVWHTWASPEEFTRKCAILDTHCDAVGRDPVSIRRATGGDEFTGAPGAAEMMARYAMADEYVARFPRDFTLDQSLRALDILVSSTS